MYKNIMFDLDGTLVDSVYDIYCCVNFTLEHFNLEKISLEDTSRYVGNGARMLIKRAINSGKHNKEYIESIENEVYNFYIEYYNEHCTDNTKLYDGVYNTLQKFNELNINMFLITNKPNDIAVKTLKKLNIFNYFKAVIGDGFYPYRKPDVNIWNNLKKDYNLFEKDTIMIGDGIADYEFAINSKIKVILALYGITDKNVLLNLKNNYYLNYFTELSDYVI